MLLFLSTCKKHFNQIECVTNLLVNELFLARVTCENNSGALYLAIQILPPLWFVRKDHLKHRVKYRFGINGITPWFALQILAD